MKQLWNLTPPRASCTLGGFSAQSDLRTPRAGLTIQQAGPLRGQQAGCGQVLGVDFHGDANLEPADVYQRGSDLVATYPDSAEFPVRVQIYWRAIPAGQLPADSLGFDLQVSVQTPEWETCPRLTAVSQVPASAAFRLADADTGEFSPVGRNSGMTKFAAPAKVSCTLLRCQYLPGHSYVEIVHPTDIGEDEPIGDVSPSGERITLSHSLFQNRLEKGVILRARLRGLLVPREHDMAAAQEAFSQFVSADLPLTT
ncbi:MAG: hypothetical protein AB7O62_18290 [Pirellulales bacterium]